MLYYLNSQSSLLDKPGLHLFVCAVIDHDYHEVMYTQWGEFKTNITSFIHADGKGQSSWTIYIQTHIMTNAETSLRASAKQAPPVPAGILRAQSPQLSRNASNPKFSGILKSSTQFTHTVDDIFRWVLFVRIAHRRGSWLGFRHTWCRCPWLRVSVLFQNTQSQNITTTSLHVLMCVHHGAGPIPIFYWSHQCFCQGSLTWAWTFRIAFPTVLAWDRHLQMGTEPPPQNPNPKGTRWWQSRSLWQSVLIQH